MSLLFSIALFHILLFTLFKVSYLYIYIYKYIYIYIYIEVKMVFSVVKPPMEMTEEESSHYKIFLAGSIDMGNAIEWQKRIEEELSLSSSSSSLTLLNPRREDWDSSWKQEIGYPPFKEQVIWELSHLEKADLILLYFDPSGPAPISLLELGK